MENKEIVKKRFETFFGLIKSIEEVWLDKELQLTEKRMIISDKARTLKELIKSELKRIHKLDRVDQLSVYESACYYWALVEANGKFIVKINTRDIRRLLDNIYDVKAEFEHYYYDLLATE